MLKLTTTNSIVSHNERLRQEIRTKLASRERAVKKLLVKGEHQLGSLRITIFEIGKELTAIQKVVVGGGYPGGFQKYVRDAHDYIRVPYSTAMTYIANFREIDRLDLPAAFLKAADSAHSHPERAGC